jgi:hypothetical protein
MEATKRAEQMQKQHWADEVNLVIASERNEYAQTFGARAYIRETDGALVYVDRKTARKTERKISLQELFGLLNGKDIRTLKAARAQRTTWL